MPLRGRQRTRRYNNNAGAFNDFLEVGWADFFGKSRLKRGPVWRASRARYVRFMGARDPDGSDGLCGTDDRPLTAPQLNRRRPLHHRLDAGCCPACCCSPSPVVARNLSDLLCPLGERRLQAFRLVGGSDAVLVIDDTAIAKKGTHSVGVAAQYASALGKTANCQTLVSLTLARGEVPVMLALRLFLQSWQTFFSASP